MEDIDLIARVYPCLDEDCEHAKAAISKSKRANSPRQIKQIRISQSNRESTEPPQDFADRLDELPYLELRFSNRPRTPAGFVFGTHSTCDFKLPEGYGISRRHFSLTYREFGDGNYRLIVRDLGSTSGTKVGYDGHGLELRRSFDWIIQGYKVPDTTNNIVIEPHERLKFKIIANKHDITSPIYRSNVEQFFGGGTNTEDLFGRINPHTGHTTQKDSRMHSPSTKQIIAVHKQLARGAYATVSHRWDVSSGHDYAFKQPASSRYEKKSWENEVETMKGLSHEYIVKVFGYTEESDPCIYMEFMPCGDLEDAHRSKPFSYEESTTIFHQSASALEYLHGRPDPIIHRDIKPRNILIQCRSPLHVKLSDFGTSKAGTLGTFCGTREYCAPEIPSSGSWQTYTTAADIWSLGVVLFRLIRGFPPGISWNTDRIGWCEWLVAQVDTAADSGKLSNILRHMLVIEPTKRLPASECVRGLSQGGVGIEPMPPAFGTIGSGPAPTEQRGGRYIKPLRRRGRPRGSRRPTPFQPPLQPPLPVNQRDSPIQLLRSEIELLDWGCIKIAYCSSKGLINATQLRKLGGVEEWKQHAFFRRNPSITKTIRPQWCNKTKGTYISLNNALFFCHRLDLPRGPVDYLTSSLINARPVSHDQGSSFNRAPYNEGDDPGPGAPMDPPDNNFPQTFDQLRAVNGAPSTNDDLVHIADEGSFMTDCLRDDQSFSLGSPDPLHV